MENFRELEKELKEVLAKHGFDDIAPGMVLETGKGVGFIVDGYIRQRYMLHFDRLLPLEEKYVKDVKEWHTRDI
jgi:hypothetical protein